MIHRLDQRGAHRGILATISAPVLNEVAALALNDTAKNAQVEAAQPLAPMMGLPSKTIKEALAITPEADLLACGNCSPLLLISHTGETGDERVAAPEDGSPSAVELRRGRDTRARLDGSNGCSSTSLPPRALKPASTMRDHPAASCLARTTASRDPSGAKPCAMITSASLRKHATGAVYESRKRR